MNERQRICAAVGLALAVLSGCGHREPVAPLPEPQAAPPPIQIERAAEAHGFTLNNFPAPKRKTLRTGRVASKDRTQAMTLRLRIVDWNRFSTFCEDQGLTVADGFSHILNKSGI